MGISSLMLGLITVLGVVEVWHVYAIALVFGVAAAFDAPARQSFVSELVDADDLTNAVGLNSATFNMARILRSEEHTSELQSLMRISYAVFCLHKKKTEIYTE